MKKIPLLILFFSFNLACTNQDNKRNNRSGTYVSPSINYKGQYRKGHFRKAYSTDKNVFKNQSRSRYYYHTRGKYRRKKH